MPPSFFIVLLSMINYYIRNCTLHSAFQTFKQEAADETDGELQIDESAGQSPVEPPECDSNSIGG